MALDEKGQMLGRGRNEHVQELQVEIGKALAEQRVRKGLTIQQVEAVTRISQCFVEDIEQGRFERLPGKIFGRGFIKNICIFLEIDPIPILEKYERSWVCVPEIMENKARRTFSLFPSERRILKSPLSSFRNFSLNRLALVLAIPAFIIVLVMVIRFIAEKRSGDIAVSSSPKVTAETNPSPAGPPANATETIPVMAKIAEPEAQLSSQPRSSELPLKEHHSRDLPPRLAVADKKPELVPQGKFDAASVPANSDNRAILILNIKEEVKIKHRVLPDDYAVTTFTPGVYRFPFDDRVDLYLYDAGAVEISFKNKNLGILGKKGEERKLTFYAKDLTPDLEKKRM